MKRLANVAVLAGVVLAAACSDGPVTPDVGGRAQLSAEGADLSALARYNAGPPNLLMGLSMKIIGPAGGSISLFGFEAVVPPGAVSKPTMFTIRLPADPFGAERVYAQFSPHQSFAVPITLKLPYRGTSAEGWDGTHVLWNSGTGWVELETTVTSDGRIQTLTNHFSEYGTQEAPAKGITLSQKPASRY